ncbi:HD domain-containing protein [Roseovarius sp. MS2]|uniref:HD domain-containing protein n=1 Tax=Roseovarius sp. MS2 TaxID=3390728 RepID=UPI003EDC04B3
MTTNGQVLRHLRENDRDSEPPNVRSENCSAGSRGDFDKVTTLNTLATYAPKATAQPWLSPLNLHAYPDPYRSDSRPKFDDPVVTALLSLAPLKRLAGIGFLGAIDYVKHGSGRDGHRRRHNRLEHSIGVAHLANVYAHEAGLDADRRSLLLCAALLHDVGHGPLSHTLEPVFLEAFGLDHHLVSRRIITGDIAFGAGIREVVHDAGVNLEELIALIDGEHDGDVGYLFSSPINLDTLEGITRCRAFVAPRPAHGMAARIVRRWAKGADHSESWFDSFWGLKHDVYNLFIGAPRGAALDAIAQTYMRTNISSFRAEDFLTSERSIFRNHPELISILRTASRGDKEVGSQIPSSWRSLEVCVRKREFFVESDARLEDNASINRRYRQSKTTTVVTLADLLE